MEGRIKIKVLLFARLRLEAGCSELECQLGVGSTVHDLATWLSWERGLSLKGCMAAVNEVYAALDTVLTEDAVVAFLPPVAGG